MKKSNLITGCAALAVTMALASAAVAQTVSYDASNGATYQGNSFTSPFQFGDEIILSAGSPRDLGTLSVDIFGSGLGAGATASIHLYKNDGALIQVGANAPGTEIGTGATVSIGNGFQHINYTDPGAVLPDRFTYTITFGNLGAGSASVPLHTSYDVGSGFDDAWVNGGSGWTLFRNPGGNPALIFGAQVTTVPEAGTVTLAVVGGLLLLGAQQLRRRSVKA